MARRDPECRIHLPNSRRRFHRAKACCIHRADRIVISSYSFSSKGKRPSAVHLPAWQVPSPSRRRPLRCAVGKMEGERTGNAGRPPEVTGDPLRGFSRGTHTSPMRSLACRESLAAAKERSGGHTGIRSGKQAIGKSHLALFGPGACQEMTEVGERERDYQQAYWDCDKSTPASA